MYPEVLTLNTMTAKYFQGRLKHMRLPQRKYFLSLTPIYCVGGVMVSVPTSSVVDPGFEPRSGQAKDYEIDICYFSAKHATLKRKDKHWLARNQNNVFDCYFNE